MKSIFIQLAAYHDFELPRTIMDAINKSSGKYQINFGVHLCYFEKQEIVIPELECVKYKVSKAPENIGLGVGRSIAHSFYNGEDYYFQIDSHSRFIDGWDEYLVNLTQEYQSMGIKKPLITNYPKNYWYNDDFSIDEDRGDSVSEISFHENVQQFKDIMIPTQTAMPNPEGNIFSRSISGGSVFTVGPFITPNADIAFYGEEIFIAARAYTNGFTPVVPTKQFMSHLYFDHTNPPKNMRRLIWSDFQDQFEEIDVISKKEIIDTFVFKKVGKLHLGEERSLSEYGLFAGLDFENREVLVDSK